ncbi:hypothetical protein C8J57DRAFT_1653104 [Mycena rebaudengoi]|nr:hypothetical protein C8J57DRAFT_1653104 [Mycena rebaudengoi]
MPKYRLKPSRGCFGIGRLDSNHEPTGIIFEVPLNGPKAIHPSAKKSLLVLDIVRLAGVCLGVLGLPPGMPTNRMPSTVTWITLHGMVEQTIQENDITQTLKSSHLEDWIDQTLWIHIRGKQPDTVEDLAERIVRSISIWDLEQRGSTNELKERFENDFGRSAKKCEFSGDLLATEIMHIMSVELGTGIFAELLRSVRTLADVYWDSMDDQLEAFPHDPNNPVIGNVAMLQADLVLKPAKCINSAKNLVIGARSVHYINDIKLGIFSSTTPPTWLVNADTCHSVVAFRATDRLSHPDLPPFAVIPLDGYIDQERFVVRWLADAITLLSKFSTPLLNQQNEEFIAKIKLAARRRKVEFRLLRAAQKRKADQAANSELNWPGLQHLCRLLTTPSELEYEVDIAEDRPRVLKATSSRLLAQLFNVLHPGEDEVERPDSLNQKAMGCLVLLGNFHHHPQSTLTLLISGFSPSSPDAPRSERYRVPNVLAPAVPLRGSLQRPRAVQVLSRDRILLQIFVMVFFQKIVVVESHALGPDQL